MKTNLKPCPIREMAGGVGLLTLMALGLSLPHAAQAAKVNPKTVPVSLVTMGETAENVYDAAKVANWKLATTKTLALKEAVHTLPPRSKAMVNQFRLNLRLQNLRGAVQSHQKWAAMHEANRVTLFAAKLSRDFAPRVPVEVTLLDVYGRDLEIGALSQDRVYLAKAQRDLAATWTRIRPAVIKRGGARQARTFGALVTSVQKAQTPVQFARLANPVLDEVDNLEKVFEK